MILIRMKLISHFRTEDLMRGTFMVKINESSSRHHEMVILGILLVILQRALILVLQISKPNQKKSFHQF